MKEIIRGSLGVPAPHAARVLLEKHIFNIGDLNAGTHFLQLLLEDHGTTNGYAAEISAHVFIPPAEIPVPAALRLFGSGLIGLIGIVTRKKKVLPTS